MMDDDFIPPPPEEDIGKEKTAKEPGAKGQRVWLIYVSVFLSGMLLLADAVSYEPLQKITAKLGIALVLSAIALTVGNGRTSGYVATGLIWVAVIVTFIL